MPVRVRQCELKGLLAQIVYIDLMGLDEEAAREALLNGVVRGRAKPESAPSFPGEARRSAAERPRFPGALPRVWNVPHQRNPSFTGRERLLESLRTALTSGKPAAVTQAIAGLGGVGKTQLALEYAYRYAPEYEVVWWVRSEEAATLGADYAALAGALDLREKDAPDQRAAVDAVRRWLEQNRGWLLAFDNAPGASEVRSYLPRGATGHVLVTSRNPVWGGTATPLPVRQFERRESVEFLLRCTGQADETSAGALADALGDLPLALEQAGAYIEETGRSISGYLELFRDRRRELLARGMPSTEYPDTVATTWEISFQQVEGTPAADLLRLVAFLAPDDVPRSLLSEGTEHLPEPLGGAVADSLALDDALAALRRYSLAEVTEESLSVHRLVQAVVRDRMPQDDRSRWAGAAVELVNAAFPFDRNDLETWAGSARLLPHALAGAAHAESLDVAPETTGRLLNEAGRYLRVRAELAEAKVVLERALAIDENAYGPDHPTVAIRVNNLGGVLRDLGDLEGARASYERALAIDEAAYGPDHSGVAIYGNNLGLVLRAQGDLEGARARFERALAIDEKAHGPNHPDVAIRVNNLGRVLYDLGDLEGARASFERALAIGERVYGPDHPTVAIRVNNLGSVLREMGDLEGARAHLERALAIDEAAYSLTHPNVARDVNNLGGVLRALGDLEGARARFERALAIDEAAYGPDHTQVAIYVSNLGSVLRDMGDLEGALRIFQEFLGDDHPNTVLVRNNLPSLDD